MNNKELFYKYIAPKAHKEFPMWDIKVESCTKQGMMHKYDFCIYCDSGEYDIMRCIRCGAETVTKCIFDEEYE